MVFVSLPPTIPDFEGSINHIVVAGNETLTFIKPNNWRAEYDRIRKKFQELAPSAQKIASLPAVKSGEMYMVKIKNSYERAYVIRCPTPESFSTYLIDKGMQCEISFGQIYEMPSEILEFDLFCCVCPFVLPSADQLDIYKLYIGHKCKCLVENVSRSIVVMGYVRGHLLVENNGNFENVEEIAASKKADRCVGVAGKFNAFGKEAISFGLTDDSSTSSSESSFQRFFSPQDGGYRTFSGRNDYSTGKRQDRADAEFVAQYDRFRVGTLFNQTAFKQYKPEIVPITVSVRFDKRDRMLSTFWVVNKKVFSAVEKALKDRADTLLRFPLFCRGGGDFQMRETPCIVRARADTAHRSLYRAVPAQYDNRTRRYSIFLVDFGWFKWVLANDIFDISSMDKSDPIMNLPVAMIHCREDTTSTLHAKDLSRGADCDIVVKGQAIRDVYTVDLIESIDPSISQLAAAINERVNGREGTLGNLHDTEMTASCRKLILETCQRQLMTSMMMETLRIVNRELSHQQPQHFWPNIYSSPFSLPMPVMMPIPFPVMMPVPVPAANMQGAGNHSTAMPENKPTNNFEKGRNGFERGRNGFESGRNRFEGSRHGFESGKNGFGGARNGHEGGRNRYEGGRNGYGGGRTGYGSGRSGYEGGRNAFGNNGCGRNGYENFNFADDGARGRPNPRMGNNNRTPRFQSSQLKPSRDWLRNDWNAKSGFGVASGDKNRKPPDEEDIAAIWDLPSKSPKERSFNRNRDSNDSPKPEITDSEKAANRTNRSQPENSSDAV